MTVVRLDLEHVRNIERAVLEPSAGCNLVYGANASGKTSLLEGIHFLGLARSFRTTHVRQVISRGEDWLRVLGRQRQSDGSEIALGVERAGEETRIRVGGADVARAAELAWVLPLQVLNPEAHELLERGPRFRRQFLDWGVFHVEPGFMETWKVFHRSLRQRNAALRSRAPAKAVSAWDEALATAGEAVAAARRDYLKRLEGILAAYVTRLLGVEIAFEIHRGWPREVSYLEALAGAVGSDREAGYTRYGPHRADISIRVDGIAVQQSLSRGQQKLLVSAMRLAQVRRLSDLRGEPGIVLVDDLPAELDRTRRGILLGLLAEIGAQVFVTCTERELLDLSAWPASKVFHVEHGLVSEAT